MGDIEEKNTMDRMKIINRKLEGNESMLLKNCPLDTALFVLQSLQMGPKISTEEEQTPSNHLESTEVLRLLDFILNEDSGYQHLLNGAIDTLDRGNVRRIICQSSGRDLYLVQGGYIDHNTMSNNSHNLFSTARSLLNHRPSHTFQAPFKDSYSMDNHYDAQDQNRSYLSTDPKFHKNMSSPRSSLDKNRHGYHMRMKQTYIVLDHKYCSCRSFYEMKSYQSNMENSVSSDVSEQSSEGQENINPASESYICKHILAVYLAPSLERLSTVSVSDSDFHKYMITF